MVNIWLIIIWLVVEPATPLKNDGVKVSWDDEIPNRWKKHVPNHQSEIGATVVIFIPITKVVRLYPEKCRGITAIHSHVS